MVCTSQVLNSNSIVNVSECSRTFNLSTDSTPSAQKYRAVRCGSLGCSPVNSLISPHHPQISQKLQEITETLVNSFITQDFSRLDSHNRKRFERIAEILKAKPFCTSLMESNICNAQTDVENREVYIYQGLLRGIINKEGKDASWQTAAFYIAHEIAHTIEEELGELKSSTGREAKANMHDMENECDRLALTLMDVAGFNVRCATFRPLGDKVVSIESTNYGVIFSHPNSYQREEGLRQQVRSGYWQSYSEENTLPFTPQEAAQLNSLTTLETALDSSKSQKQSLASTIFRCYSKVLHFLWECNGPTGSNTYYQYPTHSEIQLDPEWQDLFNTYLNQKLTSGKSRESDLREEHAKFVSQGKMPEGEESFKGFCVGVFYSSLSCLKTFEEICGDLYEKKASDPHIRKYLDEQKYRIETASAAARSCIHEIEILCKNSSLSLQGSSKIKEFFISMLQLGQHYHFVSPNAAVQIEEQDATIQLLESLPALLSLKPEHAQKETPFASIHSRFIISLQNFVARELNGCWQSAPAKKIADLFELVAYNLGGINSHNTKIFFGEKTSEILSSLLDRGSYVACKVFLSVCSESDITSLINNPNFEELLFNPHFSGFFTSRTLTDYVSTAVLFNLATHANCKDFEKIVSALWISLYKKTENEREAYREDLSILKSRILDVDAIEGQECRKMIASIFLMYQQNPELQEYAQLCVLSGEEPRQHARETKETDVQALVLGASEQSLLTTACILGSSGNGNYRFKEIIALRIFSEAKLQRTEGIVKYGVLPSGKSAQVLTSQARENYSKLSLAMMNGFGWAWAGESFIPQNQQLDTYETRLDDHALKVLLALGYNSESLAALDSLLKLRDPLNEAVLEELLPFCSSQAKVKINAEKNSILPAYSETAGVPEISYSDLLYLRFFNSERGREVLALSPSDFLQWIKTYWPKPSPLRDGILTQTLRNRFAKISDSTSRSELIGLFHREERSLPFRLQHFETEQKLCASFASKIALVQEVFPSASKVRDELIENVFGSSRFTLEQAISVFPLLSANSRIAQRDESLVSGTLLAAVAQLKGKEKAEVLQWLCAKSPKPEKVSEIELQLAGHLDELKEAFQIPMARRAMLDALLSGNNGLLAASNNAAFVLCTQSLVGDLFTEYTSDSSETIKLKKFGEGLWEKMLAIDDNNKRLAIIEAVLDIPQDQISPERVLGEALRAIGPEGVRLSQILASRPEIERSYPALYAVLGEAKSNEKPMPMLEMLRALALNHALRKCDVEILGRKGNASIAGAFEALVNEESRVIKVRRVHVDKDLPHNETCFRKFVSSVGPLLKKHFGIQHVPDYSRRIFAGLRLDVNFPAEMENNVRLSNVQIDFHFPDTKVIVAEIAKELSDFNSIVLYTAAGRALNAQNRNSKRSALLQRLFLHQKRKGFGHADLHDGNIFEDKSTGKNIYTEIDTGSCFELKSKSEHKIINGLVLAAACPGFISKRVFRSLIKTVLGDETFDKHEEYIKKEIASLTKESASGRVLRFLNLVESVPGANVPEVVFDMLMALSKRPEVFTFHIINILEYVKFFKL